MTMPRRSQLLLPLLESLKEAGGSARPRDIYDQVAEKLDLSPVDRIRSFASGGAQGSLFERSVRWQRQSSVAKAQIAADARGVWSLTDHGYGALADAKPGVIFTIFETGLGKALWCSLETALGVVESGQVDLIFSSPPYPGALKNYAAGSLDEDSWVAMVFDSIQALGPTLKNSGSMIWNVAEMYRPGEPVKGEHISKLRVRLAQETRFRVLDTMIWDNTSRLPSPFNWVASRRIRLKPSAETLLWISENPCLAKADNRAVLCDYRPSMLAHLDGSKPYRQTGRHPSGHRFSSGGFSGDNGGSIAGNVIRMGASGGGRAYYAGCREDGLPVHPAVMPQPLAEFAIRFTTQPDDLVFDPFAGSLTTGAAAEKLGRRWICSDLALAYVTGGRHRFPRRTERSDIISAVLDGTRRYDI